VRRAFIHTLVELAERDSRILLLTGDLGFMALEPFAERFPSRFFNVGVAEQNMVGLATGLAECGFVPFVYSIATFASLRTYEFIRNGPVLHHLPVRVVGMGGGFEYGSAGPTHHALEDAGAMRLLPGMTVISPADHEQARAALLASWDLPGPIYFRLGKDDRTLVPSLAGRFRLARPEVIGDGRDLVIFAMGAIASEAAAAVSSLAAEGIAATLVVVATLAPVEEEELVAVLSKFPLAVTVEAHSVVGGLGSLVAEVVAEHQLSCRLLRCGVRQPMHGLGGSQRFLEHRHGISAAAIVDVARRGLQTSGRPFER
jgi:transketolase